MFKKFFIGLTIFVFLVSFKTENRKHTISDLEYKYSFHLSDKEPKKFDTKKRYYWYKSQKLHSTIGSSNGSLLDGEYIKSYRTDELAEKGNFKNGLKHGVWTQWFENGNIKSISSWNKGLQSRKYILYDENGTIKELGAFNKGVRNGMWVDFSRADTTYYKKGFIVGDSIVQDTIKKSWFKRDSTKNKGKEKDTIKEKKKLFKKGFFKKKTESSAEKEKDTTSFFKKIFKKKENKKKAQD